MPKSKKIAHRKKVALELLHHRLRQRYTRSLMAGDAENVWKDVELRIYPDLFCTSCQISSVNKKARSKIPLKLKAPFKRFFMNIIPATSPIFLTSKTTLSNYFFNCSCILKISKTYGREIITI